MTVRCELVRKRVPREAYLVSRMRRYKRPHSVLRFTVRHAHRPELSRGTLHERRFTRKRSESTIAVEALMNNAARVTALLRASLGSLWYWNFKNIFVGDPPLDPFARPCHAILLR